ncbi:GNAT family N-acetyltransferase [Pontibacillus marinus]|uniref:N-acetyltransferase domain-containing protein n=1 Tax=Pontibacillus marinus BH030004 = DSM 16465 TaxID=1385511 RepID=A0A0A5FSF4_9BACI|nr:GNAT family N-acetyltransferase [Pontibacillus marinus]KGX83711.1 hypothetical protein N783_21935 [Pontibacillus marinus BH030004 = DSM 16465]
MQTLSFHINYGENQSRREQLYPLFDTVFNIPVEAFRDFHSKGFWDESYRPFTYFEEEKAVANVSLFHMEFLINGEKLGATGIQSVITHPDYRGKGLMKSLFREALAFIDQQGGPAFLMTSSPELYTPFGFESLEEYYFVRSYGHKPGSATQLQKVDIFNEEELATFRSMWEKRAPLSKEFMPLRYQSSFFLNMYNPNLHELLYYCDSLDAYLVYDIEDGTLELFDIIADQIPDLEDICRAIPEPFENIALYFNPDQFEEGFEAVKYETVDHFMVRGAFDLEELKIKLPITAEF